jgi:hypothetical protein
MQEFTGILFSILDPELRSSLPSTKVWDGESNGVASLLFLFKEVLKSNGVVISKSKKSEKDSRGQ